MGVGTKKPMHSSSDRISLLPDTVLENVLAYLPLHEAASTSVLSKRWRYLWTNVPELVFDDEFCNESIQEDNTKLMLTIYGVVFPHRRSILKFELSLPNLNSCSEIDRLILFLSEKGVRDLSIEIWSGEGYKLPSSLFSCVQLEHLNLRLCIIRSASNFKGFSMLVSLNLCRVDVSSGEFLSCLISSCPILEHLTLEDLTYYHLEIAAPKLKFFNYVGFFWSISFKCPSHLEALKIDMWDSDIRGEDNNGTSAPTLFFDDFSSIKSLELKGYAVKHMFINGVPEGLGKILANLQFLNLYNIPSRIIHDPVNVISLLRSSPNLENITFQADDFQNGTEFQDFETSDICLNQLREVKMKSICGTKLELMIIELLLASSPKLERMFIEPNVKKVKDNGLKILIELAQFRRASPLAKITYSNPDKA